MIPRILRDSVGLRIGQVPGGGGGDAKLSERDTRSPAREPPDCGSQGSRRSHRGSGHNRIRGDLAQLAEHSVRTVEPRQAWRGDIPGWRGSGFEPPGPHMKKVTVVYEMEDDDPIEEGDYLQAESVFDVNHVAKCFGWWSGPVTEVIEGLDHN